MKYEIRKRNKKDKNVWIAVAWADTWEWANEVASSLSCVSDGDFAVSSPAWGRGLKYGQVHQKDADVHVVSPLRGDVN